MEGNFQMTIIPLSPVLHIHDPLHNPYPLETESWLCHLNTSANQFLTMKTKIHKRDCKAKL